MITHRVILRSQQEALTMLESIELFALEQKDPPWTTFRPWETGVLVVQQAPIRRNARATAFLECDIPLEMLHERHVVVLTYVVSIAPSSTSLVDVALAWNIVAAMRRVSRIAFWLDQRTTSMSCSRVPRSVQLADVGIRGCLGHLV